MNVIVLESLLTPALRETTWLTKSRSEILALARSEGFVMEADFVEVSLRDIQPVNYRVYTASATTRQLLRELFAPPLPDCRDWVSFYFVASGQGAEARSVLPQVVATPFLACFDPGQTIALLYGEEAFGLLKSTLIGVHSALLQHKGYVPVHGAALSHQGAVTLLVGTSGVGKTTLLLNLMQQPAAEQLEVLTDDWSLIATGVDAVQVVALEKNLSFKQQHVQENPHLDLMPVYQAHKRPLASKAYIPRQALYGERVADSGRLKRVVFLDSQPSPDLITAINPDRAQQLLIETAYHMPDCAQDLKRAHNAFWATQLLQLESFRFHPRQPGLSQAQICQALLERIIAPANPEVWSRQRP